MKNDMTECQRAALHYADPAASGFGWKIFAARMEAGKKYAWTSKEHAPGGENWGMTDDLVQLKKNFENPRWRLKCGVGVPTGWVNKLIVIETDTIVGHGVDGKKALRALEKKHGKLPKTMMAKSPTASVHRYYRHPGEHIRCKSFTLVAGVDVKADGGMVIAPPSVRHDGKYVWTNNEPIAELPAAWLELIKDESPNIKGNGADDPFAEGLYEELTEDEKTAGCIAIRDHLPNDDDDWDEWNTKGLKIFNTVPDERGLEAFDGYSQRSSKYDETKTTKKWEAFHKSPPTHITTGSFNYLVSLAGGVDDTPAEEWVTKPKTNGAAPAADMGVPADLWDTFGAPELPRGLLPPVIETCAFAYAKLQGSDPAGFAMGALMACAAVIPNRIRIQPKRHDPWTQPTILWFAMVGSSSTMKSPIFRAATHVAEQLNKELVIDYKKKMEEWESLEAKEKKETPKPKKLRLTVEDVTIESVQNIAEDSPDGLYMVKDELSGLFASMEQYGGKHGMSAARPFYLQAYEGRSYSWDRAGARGSGYIESLGLCMFGGIQPDLIRKIVWAGYDDGLVERFIPLILRDSEVDDDTPLPPEAKQFDALVRSLYRMRKRHDSDLVKFDDEALKVREELAVKHNHLAKLFKHSNKSLASHIIKYNGVFARLCLLWHLIEHHDDTWESDIDVHTARRVARFIHEFLWPHAMSFYYGILQVGGEHDKLMQLAGYILAHKKEMVKNRDLQMSMQTFRGLTRKEIESVFEQLSALGWVDRHTPKTAKAGDPPHWKVNMAVHQLYAKRAKQEEQHREEVREMIQLSVVKRKQEREENGKSQH
jgi:hypothetical protein